MNNDDWLVKFKSKYFQYTLCASYHIPCEISYNMRVFTSQNLFTKV